MFLIVLTLLFAPADAAPSCEHLFQGDWQLASHESGNPSGTLHVEGREFRAESIHGSYTGTIAVRSDVSPAQVDFTIRECGCKFEGMTAAGIFYEEDGAIVFASPAPGEPRPESFDELDPASILIERATRPVATEGS